MLRVTIEYVPLGQEARASTLMVLTIANVGGTRERGKYKCVLDYVQHDTQRVVHIEDWPRLEREAPALVCAALEKFGYGEGG